MKLSSGMRVGQLTLIEKVRLEGKSKRYWRCVCDCGVIKEIHPACLLTESVKSCGCFRRSRTKFSRDAFTQHWRTVNYVWLAMIQRCTNPNNPSYANYGGRGITVCEEWLNRDNFIAWAKDRWKPGLFIDRRDNNQGYSPSNCHFVTRKENQNNCRVRVTNRTGYAGTSVDKSRNKFVATVGRANLGRFDTLKEAVEARNTYILENNLLAKIQPYKESDHVNQSYYR